MDYEAEIKGLKEKIATLELEIQELPNVVIHKIVCELCNATSLVAKPDLKNGTIIRLG